MGLLMAGTALTRPALARDYGRGAGMPWEPMTGDTPYYGTGDALFFSAGERATVAAIVARLIPSDEDGPGAPEADVVTFLDRQLAGFYGRGQHWYMRGPFEEGLPTQGYQSEHTPAALYRHGLAALDVHCRAAHGAPFAELAEPDQDAVLKGLEEEEISFPDVPAKAFFDFLLENAVEGFFADPVYGGNRDMVGWRYVGFPGTRYDYRDFVGHDGARIALPPVGLAGGPEWRVPQA
jgi:gluconate 2-dehydrogenase gamma chain